MYPESSPTFCIANFSQGGFIYTNISVQHFLSHIFAISKKPSPSSQPLAFFAANPTIGALPLTGSWKTVNELCKKVSPNTAGGQTGQAIG